MQINDEKLSELWSHLIGFPVTAKDSKVILRFEFLPEDFSPEFFHFPENGFLRIYRGVQTAPQHTNLRSPGCWWSARISCARSYYGAYNVGSLLTGLIPTNRRDVRMHLRDLIDNKSDTFIKRGGYKGEGDHPQLELGNGAVEDVEILESREKPIILYRNPYKEKYNEIISEISTK